MASTGGNSSAGIFHDTVKDMVCRWAEGNGYGFEKEAKAYKFLENGFIPDVVLTLTRAAAAEHKRKTKVFIEVQRNVSPEWKLRHHAIYAGKDWICIDLNKIDYMYGNDALTTTMMIEDLWRDVSEQLDNETLLPPKEKRTAGDWYVTCPTCLDRIKIKSIKSHRAKHWKEAQKKIKEAMLE